MIEGERMATFLRLLEPDNPGWLITLEKRALKERVPIIRPQIQSLLRFLLVQSRPRAVLEVGTAVGFSTLFMSEYLPPEGHITTIEKCESRIEEAKRHFREFGRESRITLLEGDAAVCLRRLRGPFDFIFMDAAKGQYLRFLEEALRLLSPGGLLVSDNVLQEGEILESRYAVTRRDRTIHGRMREYLYEIKHHPQLETVVLPMGDGATVSVRKQ